MTVSEKLEKYREICKETQCDRSKGCHGIAQCEIALIIEALTLLELKEQNRIIELPAQVGEICYVIMTDFEDNMRVSRAFFTRTLIEAMIMGEPVFATKEEAEARLAKLRGE